MTVGTHEAKEIARADETGLWSIERQGSQVLKRKVQLQFLWNAKARVPAVTSDLFEVCYPSYCELVESTGLPQQTQSPIKYQNLDWKELKDRKDLELPSLLNEWSKRFGLEADWCKQWALTAMRSWISDQEAKATLSWCRFPDIVRLILFPQFYGHIAFDCERLRTIRWAIEQLRIVDFGPDSESSERPQPPEGLPDWHYASTNRAEYLRDVKRFTLEEIETSDFLAAAGSSMKAAYVREVLRVAAIYCDGVERHLSKTRSWQKSRVFRDYRAHVKHVVWAVMFQVQGRSYSEIAEDMQAELDIFPAISTVHRGVNEILNIINLDSDRRGQIRRGPRSGLIPPDKQVAKKTLKALGR